MKNWPFVLIVIGSCVFWTGKIALGLLPGEDFFAQMEEQFGEELEGIESEAGTLTGDQLGAGFWPPAVGEAYPDLQLIDHTGKPRRLSSFKGKTILIEPIGMSCQACQSFSGGRQKGPFDGVSPQPNLDSIENYLPRFSGGITLDDPRLVYVQLLLFNMEMEAPTPEDVQRWAKHYGFYPRKNIYVMAGTPEMITEASYQMVPGFQLVDRNFVLRADSTGHRPKNDLYQSLLPMVPTLFAEQAAVGSAQF